MTRETPPSDKAGTAPSTTALPAAAPSAAAPFTAAPSAVLVRIEEGRDVVTVDGWELTIWHDLGDGEPHIRDVDLAVRLGLRLDKFRALSNRHEKAGNVAPRRFSPTVGENRRGRGRPGTMRFYSEADALFLVTRSEAPSAVALTRDMIRVYLAVRRGLLAREKALPLEAPLPASLPAPVDPIPPRPAHPAGAILWDLHYGPKVSAASAREALPVVDGERVRLEVLVPTAVVTALLAHAGWDAVEFEGLATIAATEGLWRFAEEVAGHKVARTERHQDSVRGGAVLFLLHKRAVDKGDVRLASEVRREALSPHPARPKRG